MFFAPFPLQKVIFQNSFYSDPVDQSKSLQCTLQQLNVFHLSPFNSFFFLKKGFAGPSPTPASKAVLMEII